MNRGEKLSKAQSKKTVRPIPDKRLEFAVCVNFLSTNRFDCTHEKERTTWYFRLKCDLSGGFCMKFYSFCGVKASSSTHNMVVARVKSCLRNRKKPLKSFLFQGFPFLYRCKAKGCCQQLKNFCKSVLGFSVKGVVDNQCCNISRTSYRIYSTTE